MTLFEYITVAVSMVLSLALVRLVEGLADGILCFLEGVP